jgi:hypothetical protein
VSGARPSGTGSRASTEPCGLGPAGFDPARDVLLLAMEARATADYRRIRRLTGAIQAMANAVSPLRNQGEDRVWRPVQRALDIAHEAILDRWPASAIERERGPQRGDAPITSYSPW